ncbi:glucuronate isomerase [Evansella cellulosilytica]|uniref:Uronate isomerase n=1 Tax=Evansella cellulosilytica (strain ATCC 21833 / DSM 2522 / FERM P-1141 / JCM 9156 / N-4) TaxID=649639 RepID=E6TXL8_EVAC2|nr:glucuronate isomerase [Evansella cellulosilytica]ADU28832.1 Glucuronate isomerase [Evansella cellulosilytica DSM 2522]
MGGFITENYLLTSESAKILYHDYAKKMPIYDYHCHLSPKEIAENKTFRNMTEIWLDGDHYKWRVMRALGVEEKYITGNASDYEKFRAWAKTVPQIIGNPLYQWTHMELKRYFHTDLLLNEDTCDIVWEHCNSLLQTAALSAQKIIEQSQVKMIGTTDDPVDDLIYHQAIMKNERFKTKVLPTFRPDQAYEIRKQGYNEYVDKLSTVTSTRIDSFQSFLQALESRIQYFHKMGCRISDHGLETLPYEDASTEEVESIFSSARQGEKVTLLEEYKFKTYVLSFLGRLYHSLGWAMQLHIGPLRDNNEKMFARIGANTGFDSINDYFLAKPLNAFLNRLEKSSELPKMIIYSLNPNHNEVIASACGNFHSASMKGKIQFGAGWWYNDHKDGMIRQMTDLANTGVLSTFIGMLTDSRSFLSYTRHEYFRRVLCEMVGKWIESGEAPRDYKLLGEMIQNISYNNAANYFEVQTH